LLLAHRFQYLAVTPATSTSNQTRSASFASGTWHVFADCAFLALRPSSVPQRNAAGRPELSGAAAQDQLFNRSRGNGRSELTA